MRKPFRFNELSDKKCACGARLKKNLLAKRPDADKCFKCFYPNRNPNVSGRSYRIRRTPKSV